MISVFASRIFSPIVILILFCFTKGFSQEQDSIVNAGDAMLPKFDVPEFQVTGKEIIALPPSAKKNTVEFKSFDATKVILQPPDKRKNAFDEKFSLFPLETDSIQLYPLRASIRIGRFLFQQLEVSYGIKKDIASYFTKGQLQSSRGFQKNTDYEKGEVFFQANFFEQMASNRDYILNSASVRYNFMRYRFYGSNNPTRKSKMSALEFSGDLRSKGDQSLFKNINLQWNNFFFSDSVRRNESRINIFSTGNILFKNYLIESENGIDYNVLESAADPFAISSRNLTAVYHDTTSLFHIGLAGFLYQNSNSVINALLTPQIEYNYFFKNNLRTTLGFTPNVEAHHLQDLHYVNPFVGTAAKVFHTKNYLNFFAQTQYAPFSELEIHSELRYKKSNFFPFMIDSFSTGVWKPQYSGTTTSLIWNIETKYIFNSQQSIVGKFLIQRVKNSLFSEQLPYIHPVKLHIGYTYKFDFPLDASVSSSYSGQQTTEIDSAKKLNDVFLTDVFLHYTINSNFSAQLAVYNIFDRQYYLWKNYRGEPMIFSLNIIGRW